MRGAEAEQKCWAADAQDVGWCGVLSKKRWAANAHDAGSRGVLSQKAGQLMIMMLARVGLCAKKLGT